MNGNKMITNVIRKLIDIPDIDAYVKKWVRENSDKIHENMIEKIKNNQK